MTIKMIQIGEEHDEYYPSERDEPEAQNSL